MTNGEFQEHVISELKAIRQDMANMATKSDIEEIKESLVRIGGTVETLYLTSIPGMKEKLLKGANTPLSECVEDE